MMMHPAKNVSRSAVWLFISFFLIKLKLYVLAWINWYLILATHFRKLIFIKLEFNSGIKDQPMFFLFRQKEPIRPAGGPPLRLFVRQCDHARLAQKWSANLQVGRTLMTMLSRPNSNQDDNIKTGRAGTWAQKLNLWEPTPPNVTERSDKFPRRV